MDDRLRRMKEIASEAAFVAMEQYPEGTPPDTMVMAIKEHLGKITSFLPHVRWEGMSRLMGMLGAVEAGIWADPVLRWATDVLLANAGDYLHRRGEFDQVATEDKMRRVEQARVDLDLALVDVENIFCMRLSERELAGNDLDI